MSSYQPGHDISTKERTVDVLTTENVSFKDLLLSSQVLCGLRKSRFDRPSPIQLKAIPYGRCGLDLIVQAKSGTGKTCVFSVIALEAISVEALTLQVLILAPTREIAIQIEDVIKAIGQDIKGLNIAAFIGGRPVSEDKVNAKGCHIAVGSPGRIFQLIELEILKCQNIRILVLDEADKLLEDNFQSQINSIYSMLPANKQMIAASATYPKELANFVTLYMRDPTFVRLNPQDMALLGVKQYYYQIEDPPDKFVSVFECKIKAVVELLDLYTFQQALIFSNYHSHAKDLSDACNSVGLPATYISGNLEQERRLEAMKMLKDFKCRVLISTDLTSRGIDASNVDLVLNLDVPMDWETYMHRTGRAGRFGTRGAVISVVTSGKERDDLFKIAETCAVQLYSLTFQSGKVVLGLLPVDFSELSTDQSNQGCHEMKATKMRSTTKKNVPFLNPASKVEPPTETLNSFEDENLPQGSSQIEPRCHELKGTKMRSTTKKNVPFQNLASKAEPFETLNSYEDRNLPQSSLPNEQILQIPSLPELMSKTCDAAKFSFSFSYHDLMENYLHFKEHGVFKELKRIDRIDSPEKRGFDQADCEQDSKKLLSKIMLQEYQDASKDPTEKVPETTGNGSLNKVNGRSTNIRNKITEEDYRSRHVQGEGLENPGMDREWHQEAVRGCHKQGSEEELKQHPDVSLFKTGDQDLCKKKHEKEKELFNKTEPSQSTTEETARSRPKNKKNKKTRSTNDFVDSHFSTHPNFLLPRYSPRFENEGFEDFTRMPDHVHVLRQYQQAWDNHWYWWTQWYNMSNFRR